MSWHCCCHLSHRNRNINFLSHVRRNLSGLFTFPYQIWEDLLLVTFISKEHSFSSSFTFDLFEFFLLSVCLHTVKWRRVCYAEELMCNRLLSIHILVRDCHPGSERLKNFLSKSIRVYFCIEVEALDRAHMKYLSAMCVHSRNTFKSIIELETDKEFLEVVICIFYETISWTMQSLNIESNFQLRRSEFDDNKCDCRRSSRYRFNATRSTTANIINLFLINSSPFLPCINSQCAAFTFSVALNCVTEIIFNVFCTQLNARCSSSMPLKFKHSFNSILFFRDFYRSFCLLLCFFSSPRIRLIVNCVSKKCSSFISWIAQSRFPCLNLFSKFLSLLINYHDLEHFSSSFLLELLFVNYKVNAFYFMMGSFEC